MLGALENKAIVRRFIDEVFVRGNRDVLDELLTDDFVGHTWQSITGNGKRDLALAMERVSKGLADAAFVVEDIIAEGDRVAVRVTASATQVGDLMGMPGNGRRYTIGEIHIFGLRDGRIAEHWHQFDQVGMMRQLGAMPGGGQPGGGQPAAASEGDGAASATASGAAPTAPDAPSAQSSAAASATPDRRGPNGEMPIE